MLPLLLVACLTAPAAITPVPDVVPAAVADVQEAQVPDRVQLEGMVGTRIVASTVNRLLEIDVDRLLEGYRKRPGRQTWDGEHVGKWLHAASLAWANSGDERLHAKIAKAVAELVACQQEDGYLGTYLPAQRWTEWDVWAHKYNLIGLVSWMRLSGDRSALPCCRAMADLLCREFGDGKRDLNKAGAHQGMAPGSVLEPMVWMYRFTGETRYRDFCSYILRNWETPTGPHIVSRLVAGLGVDKVGNAKAYEMMSCINGMLEWYRVSGDKDLLTAGENAWTDITAKRRYITGTASWKEHFHDDFNLPNTSDVGETCVTVTWLQFNAHLLRLTGKARYADELERIVYNQLPGAQQPDGRAWGYYVQMEGLKPYTSTLDGQCCLSSGPRGFALIPTFAITADAEGVVVNLEDAGKASLRLHDGTAVGVTIATAYPAEPTVDIAVAPEHPEAFTVRLRIPAWCSTATLSLAGAALPVAAGPDGYVAVHRTWTGAEHLLLTLPPTPRVVGG
nr:glycoside hydrolase family 127 protein [Planctomycetota bacterium]